MSSTPVKCAGVGSVGGEAFRPMDAPRRRESCATLVEVTGEFAEAGRLTLGDV